MAKVKQCPPQKVNLAPATEKLYILGEGELKDPILLRETFWKGRRKISIRAYYWEERSQKYFPSKRGMDIRLEYLEELIEGLQAIRTTIIQHSSSQGSSEFDKPEYTG